MSENKSTDSEESCQSAKLMVRCNTQNTPKPEIRSENEISDIWGMMVKKFCTILEIEEERKR